MRSRLLVEFTGERVVPDQVNPDLWSEHLARYAFAARYAVDRRVLDCGCGTGYGSAELAQEAADVTGIDISEEAIEYAQLNYGRPNTRYVAGSCLDLAFPAASFDLVVAFEVIEHLSDFRRFLEECARVLTPDGLFIVSTPNKCYYAESRAESGPNPFHQHEFEADEFRAELSRVFPNVTLFLQNRVECLTFVADSFEPPDSRIDGGAGPPRDAHFFIGLCSTLAFPQIRPFVYVPKAANLLREREMHIRLLKDQLCRTQEWLTQTQAERDRLLKQYRDQLVVFDKQTEEIDKRTDWAEGLNLELKAARQRIDQVQREFAIEQQSATQMAAGYNAKIRELEAENVAKTKWALETSERLTAEIKQVTNDLTETLRLLKIAEETTVARTTWAQRLEAEQQVLETQLTAVRESRWVRLGRMLGLGPDVK
jgi:ubiquinone/menaquinone biosynthesis C-methylase UbiE